MKLVVGTRGSNLALTQTKQIVNELEKKGHTVEIKIIKTKGDKILDKSLDKIGDKGLFVKELESELLEGKIDFAVHSFKDMPTEMEEDLFIVPIPKREERKDVLVLNPKYSSLSELPKGSIIGTGSTRRIIQLKSIRDDLNFFPVRGNIETRIKKIESENFGGIVLAYAALKRLNLTNKISYIFSEEEILPAPAQGALAIQVRKSNKGLIRVFNEISDEDDDIEVKCEREFMRLMDGGCHSPIGASAKTNEEEIELTGIFGSENLLKVVRKAQKGKKQNYKNIALILSKKIKEELNNEK
ncbi:hydroxymethylbilane synthase [Helicovermis profundi]|uniref:Porphobilinogen deaminase n=1 Tax=Helicovermis profundi TaxID=3065157 RepID=A0AAU9E2H8_9FIRM|nr:hydroxymethylbilane synthase [Clostridia bacterium S502]